MRLVACIHTVLLCSLDLLSLPCPTPHLYFPVTHMIREQIHYPTARKYSLSSICPQPQTPPSQSLFCLLERKGTRRERERERKKGTACVSLPWQTKLKSQTSIQPNITQGRQTRDELLIIPGRIPLGSFTVAVLCSSSADNSCFRWILDILMEVIIYT